MSKYLMELADEQEGASVVSHACALDILFSNYAGLENICLPGQAQGRRIYYNNGNKKFKLPPQIKSS